MKLKHATKILLWGFIMVVLVITIFPVFALSFVDNQTEENITETDIVELPVLNISKANMTSEVNIILNETMNTTSTKLTNTTKTLDPVVNETVILVDQLEYIYQHKIITNTYGNKSENLVLGLKVLRKSKEESKSMYEEAELKPNLKSIRKIRFNDIEIINNTISIGIEELNKPNFVQSYAIDPTHLNFTNASVTVVAKGTELYKCKDWNFSLKECYGEWKLFKTGLIPGEEYSFILTPDDPAFGEIIITNAQHLDSDRNFISDIYNEVKEKDGVWSEEINSGEYVRVTYEKNLTNGNVIDVFVRSPRDDSGEPGRGSFEVFVEKDDSNLLGSSGFVDSAGGWKYITLESVNNPTDTFDFKISGSLEFDYIHDAPPNLSSVILNSTLGTNLTTENLTVYTDQDDNSSLKLIYTWKKDGQSASVLNMPFEGGSNSSFTKDYSDNANNATGFNGSLWQSNGGYDGKGAYKFNRSAETYFSVPDFAYPDNFTISFWLKTPALSGTSWHYIYSHGTWNSFNNVRIYFAESNGNLFAQMRDSNDVAAMSLIKGGLDDGNWHFITLTVGQGIGAAFYVDGVFDSSNNTVGTDAFNPGTDLFIAKRSDLANRYFNGWVDDLRVHNSILSLDQIILLNNSQPNKIHSSETSVGDVWQACAIPNDGIEDGNEVCSNNLTILSPSSGSVSVRVSQSSDDAEESVDGPFIGDTEIDSSDLEMVDDPDFQQGNQTIGLRFQNVDIPNGAVITNAYIEFEVDEINSGTTNLRIYGEDADNPATFFNVANNITPRTKTTAFAAWDNIPAWDTLDAKQQTADISNVVKEIVDRSGWVSGNSMVFIINGTGKRVAEAWDGEPANAPLLIVNWTTISNSAPSIDSLVLNSTSATNLTTENLTAYSTTSDADNDTVKVIYNWKKNDQSTSVLHMPFEGGSTSTFTKDYAGIANGTVVGATYNSTGGYDGKGAYEFDGGNDYISIPDGAMFDLDANGNYSWSFWVAPDGFSEFSSMWGQTLQDGNYLIIYVHTTTSTKWGPVTAGISVGWESTNGVDELVVHTTDNALTTNGFYHVVVTYDGSKSQTSRIAIFVNGSDVTDTGDVLSLGTLGNVTPNNIRIGNNAAFAGEEFDGTIDELKIYDQGLSSEQISALYNNRTDLIVSQETSIGDVWSVSATPNDGTEDGISVLSNNLTVVSDGPAVSLNSPEHSVTLNSSQVTFNCSATDDNGLQNMTLYLSESNGSVGSVEYLSNYSVWKYNDSNVYPAADWFNESFDDSSWPSGAARIGVETVGGWLNTTLNGGGDTYPSYYFRTTFNVNSVLDVINISFNIDYDDGYVVYLNSYEINRSNSTVGVDETNHSALTTATHNWACDGDTPPTCTPGGNSDPVWPKIILNSTHLSYLNDGENTLAVLIKQRTVASSDSMLMLNLYGYERQYPNLQANETKNISGTSNESIFTSNLNNSYYSWNCLAYDSSGNSDFGNSDRSLRVNVANNPPQITQVQPVNTITLTSFSITNVNVLFNVTDADGFADLNDSLSWCGLSKTGETNRTSSSCAAQNQSGNDLIYSCPLAMQFYDSAGVWNITCYAEDISGNNATNDTETATVNSLNYVAQDLLNLNWSGLSPGNNNEEAQSPLIFANGGNQNYSNFNITSQNATSGSYIITNDKFKVDNETNQSSGQTSLNDSGVNWAEGSLPKCNSPCSSNRTEVAYFYVDTPIGILGGVYASIANWTISLS